MNIDFHGDSAARAAFLHSQTALNSTIGKIFYDTQTDLAYISDGVAFDGGHTLADVGLGGGGPLQDISGVSVGYGLAGTSTYRSMSAPATAGTPTGNGQVWLSSTGCKGFEVAAKGVLGGGAAVVVAFSTNANDTAFTNALAQNVVTELNLAVGSKLGNDYSNVVILTDIGQIENVTFDGTNRIKTITAINTSALALEYIMRAVV